MCTQQINTLWKLLFIGVMLVAGMGVFVGLGTAASDNYHDFECESGGTIPLNLFDAATHQYLLDDNAELEWSAWTSTNKYDGQLVQWNETQKIESVYYFVGGIEEDKEVMFTFTAGSQKQYKSINSTSNGTWMQVPFDASDPIEASSLYIERVDTTGEDVKLFEVRVCVTAETECAPGNLAVSPDTPVMGDTTHFEIHGYTFHLDGDFSDCVIPHTMMQLDGETCATGQILSLTSTQITVRFRKYQCFSVTQANMNEGPNVNIIVGDAIYNFDLRYCPQGESVYFIN